ncbi:MAG: hypothetical protein ACLT76_09125 [Clostridium fessum]
MKSTDSVIVSWDFSHGKDVGVLIVGKQEKRQSRNHQRLSGRRGQRNLSKAGIPQIKKTSFSKEKTT